MKFSATAELETQILEDLILRGWRYYSRFQASLAEESQELDGFLNHYFLQLEGWLQQAAASEKAAKAGEGGETPCSHEASLHAAQKKLYRRIVKSCHPDVAVPSMHGFLKPAMEAYGRGDGAALALIQIEIWKRENAAEIYRDRLRAHYRELQSQVADSREAVRRLRSSPGWRLHRKILEARRSGVDLLAQVIAQLRGPEKYYA